jgi:hypothetical protein
MPKDDVLVIAHVKLEVEAVSGSIGSVVVPLIEGDGAFIVRGACLDGGHVALGRAAPDDFHMGCVVHLETDDLGNDRTQVGPLVLVPNRGFCPFCAARVRGQQNINCPRTFPGEDPRRHCEKLPALSGFPGGHVLFGLVGPGLVCPPFFEDLITFEIVPAVAHCFDIVLTADPGVEETGVLSYAL